MTYTYPRSLQTSVHSIKKPINLLKVPKKDNQYIFHWKITATTAMVSSYSRCKDGRSKTVAHSLIHQWQTVTHTQWDDEQPDWYDAATLKNGSNKLKRHRPSPVMAFERLFRNTPSAQIKMYMKYSVKISHFARFWLHALSEQQP